MARACFWIRGSELARVAMFSTPSTPATAVLTITMNMISSISENPCPARGRRHPARGSAMHIPGLGLDHDLPRRVVGDGAGERDGGRRAGAPQAVEAEAGAGAARERDAVRRG